MIITLSEQLEKIPLVVNDFPGFISNRILMPMINEAVHCYDEQVGTIESIDSIMRIGMGHPMGPLMLADLIGIDVCVNIMNILNCTEVPTFSGHSYEVSSVFVSGNHLFTGSYDNTAKMWDIKTGEKIPRFYG